MGSGHKPYFARVSVCDRHVPVRVGLLRSFSASPSYTPRPRERDPAGGGERG